MSDASDELDLVLLLAGGGGCSLDSSPGKNWVENSGGLPDYICTIAKGVMRSGKSKSAAIAVAVSRVKKWAAGGDGADADTKAKSAKAVAEWEKLKAKNKAKQVVKASYAGGGEYLMLSNISSFNTEIVRSAWRDFENARRKAVRAEAVANGTPENDTYDLVPYTYIRELWTDHILLETDGRNNGFLKVPYTVSDDKVEFGEGVEVKITFVEVKSDLTADEEQLLGDLAKFTSPLDRVLELARKR